MIRLSLSLHSLRVRLILLVLLAALPALVLILYTAKEEHNLAARHAKDKAHSLVQLVSYDQERLINETRQLLTVISQLPEIHSGDPAICSEFFQDLLNKYPLYSSIGILERNGSLFCSSPAVSKQFNLAYRTYFQRTSQKSVFTVGDYQISKVTGGESLPFGYPILDDSGQVQKVLFTELDLVWLNNVAARAELPAGSAVTVRDREGTILVRYPEPQKWVGKSVPDAPIAQAITRQPNKSTVESTGVDGITRLYAFQQLSDATGGRDVFISVGIPTDVAFADINRIWTRNLIGFGLATCLVLLIAWVGSSLFFLRRVNALMNTTKLLTAGDLSVRTGLPYGQGELGQLSRAFDGMAEALEQRERELRNAEANYRALIENIPAVTYTVNNGRFGSTLYVSPQIETMLGFTKAEWLTNPELRLKQIHPEDRQRVQREIYDRLKRLEPCRSEYRMFTRSGFQIWVRDEARLVRSKPGQSNFVQGFITDITDRKQAERTAKNAYSELNQIFNTVNDGMCVIDKRFHIIRANNAFYNLTGLNKDNKEIIGEKCYDIFSGPVCKTPNCPLNLILGGETHVEYDIEKKLQDGRNFKCIVTAAAYRNLNGKLIGVVESFKDISERKQ